MSPSERHCPLAEAITDSTVLDEIDNDREAAARRKLRFLTAFTDALVNPVLLDRINGDHDESRSHQLRFQSATSEAIADTRLLDAVDEDQAQHDRPAVLERTNARSESSRPILAKQRQRGLEDLIDQQSRIVSRSLILNPVENYPVPEDIAAAGDWRLHGLYNSDKSRTAAERMATAREFAGRQPLELMCSSVYSDFARALGAADATLRPLSGLNAHQVVFAALGSPGQAILRLPEEAGGHILGRMVLEGFGYEVIDMVVDNEACVVDLEATLRRCAGNQIAAIVVDRSEGLVVEDFRDLLQAFDCPAVYDASQTLTHVICGDHRNPFDDGFDLIVASVHKNFPGPQKALIATKEHDELWERILGAASIFVSNMHVFNIYAAGLTLNRKQWLQHYSKQMLTNAVALERELHEVGVPVVKRNPYSPPTTHLWIQEPDQASAFASFEALEQAGFLVNYRQLPYSLGFGLRLGTPAATRLGLSEHDLPALARLIAEIRRDGATPALQSQAGEFIRNLQAADARQTE